MDLIPVQDFEKTFARKLLPSDYYFNPQIGFLSLNQPLQPDEVLGVAFQYTYNGRVYQVGEFSQDVPPDTTGSYTKGIIPEIIKSNFTTYQSSDLGPDDEKCLLCWLWSIGKDRILNWMFCMKNQAWVKKDIYLQTDVLPQFEGQPIISLVNLDRLNNQNDPQPDGVFDFIEGFTVISSMSRVIFPVLEPFGHDLDYVYGTQAQRDKFLYYPLYDTIKAIAQTYANLNRFKIKGRSKSRSAEAAITSWVLIFPAVR